MSHRQRKEIITDTTPETVFWIVIVLLFIPVMLTILL